MRHVIVLLMCTALLACNSDKKPKKPDNLIPEDTMVDIMYEVFILNAAKGSSKSVLENHGIFPENYIFEKYSIDSLQFAESTEYYGVQVEAYEAIIARVEQRINQKKEIFQKIVDDEEKAKKQRMDSLKKAKKSPLVFDSIAKKAEVQLKN